MTTKLTMIRAATTTTMATAGWATARLDRTTTTMATGDGMTMMTMTTMATGVTATTTTTTTMMARRQ